MNVRNATSLEAYASLSNDKDAMLVDVRTIKEWQEIGVPNIEQNQIFFLSWRLLPNMSINQEFGSEFKKIKLKKDKKLFFLCRSGARSMEATNFVAALNYEHCYNVIDGFEGHSSNEGWKNNNLPWHLYNLYHLRA